MDTADWLEELYEDLRVREPRPKDSLPIKRINRMVTVADMHLLPNLAHVLAAALRALDGQGCFHQASYEERSATGSPIYPDIMHAGECGAETSCGACERCAVLAQAERLCGAASGEEE
jgi:hypothetical protein